MADQPTALSTAAGRLAPVRAADHVLRELRAGALGFAFSPWIPCAVVEVSCLLARYVVLPSAHARAVAVTVPRGRHHLAGLIAIYLGYARENERLPIRGCVSLATNDRETKDVLCRVRALKGLGRAPQVRQLVAGAVSRPMQGTEGSHGISQRDRELLIHEPSYQPRLAANVISASIVDAVSCGEGSWHALRSWAVDGDRAQIFVGELGDQGVRRVLRAQRHPGVGLGLRHAGHGERRWRRACGDDLVDRACPQRPAGHRLPGLRRRGGRPARP